MIEKVKRELANITNEVNELHPLLHNLFNRHTKITRTEYTHGKEEMGADFILTRTDDILETTEHIGVVAKCGKIHLNFGDVERQIEECTTIPRKIDGGKKQITLSQVWVVATGAITKGAQDKIHAKYPGTNVHFVDLDHLASLVDKFVPYYLSNIDLRISSYLQDLKAHSEELDKSLDLIQLEGEPLYINQEILRVEADPYRTGQRRKKEKPKRVDLLQEIRTNKLLLLEAGMGGGKSKLLRRLTQSYADPTTFGDEKTLPIHTTFKELVDLYNNSLEDLLQAKVPAEVRQAVDSQITYLFLVDAVDEKALPPDQLSEALAKLANEATAQGSYRLLLASRYADHLDVDRQFLNHFTRYEVATLSMGKIVSFLDTICRRLNLHSRIVEDLQRSVLFDRLPRNPIAAVLLGQLLKEKQQELPSTMTELYQKYMETVLGRWDIEKGLQSQQEFDTLENVLQDLAAYMLDNQLEAISLEEVKDRFRSYLGERNLKVEAQQLVERAVQRADVLAMSPDSHSVWFKHRSFAEFLYAKRLIKGSSVRLSQTPRIRGLLLAHSAPHAKRNTQAPDRDSSLPLSRLPTLRQQRSG